MQPDISINYQITAINRAWKRARERWGEQSQTALMLRERKSSLRPLYSIAQYNNEKDQVTIEQTFEALMKYTRALSKEEQRATREGLEDQETLAHDQLLKPELDKRDIARVKKVATSLLQTLKEKKLRVANWREKETTRDSVRQSIYDYLYDENTGLPVDSYTEDDIALITDGVFRHVYRVYPTVPSPVYS